MQALKFAFSASDDRVIWTCSGKLPLSSWTASADTRRLTAEAVTAYIMEEKEQEIAHG